MAQDLSFDTLWEMFVAKGVQPAEIANLTLEQIKAQVGELRDAEPDSLPLTDGEIAEALWVVCLRKIAETAVAV